MSAKKIEIPLRPRKTKETQAARWIKDRAGGKYEKSELKPMIFLVPAAIHRKVKIEAAHANTSVSKMMRALLMEKFGEKI